MQVISQPLEMTEEDNRRMLFASEQRVREMGDPDGNRQQRRAYASYLRKQRRKEGVSADE